MHSEAAIMERIQSSLSALLSRLVVDEYVVITSSSSLSCEVSFSDRLLLHQTSENVEVLFDEVREKIVGINV